MLGPRQGGRNIFKAKVPRLATLDVPAWVLERLVAKPDELFWQIYIEGDRTKNGQVLESILPRELGDFLENYVERYHPLLCKGAHLGPLFPSSRTGKPLSAGQMYATIVNTAFRYTGKPVNPHLARDIRTVGVLAQTDGNLADAARLLGDKSTQVVDRIYGSKFSLSHALRKLEELRDKQKALLPSTSDGRRIGITVLVRQLQTLLSQAGLNDVGEVQAQLVKLQERMGSADSHVRGLTGTR